MGGRKEPNDGDHDEEEKDRDSQQPGGGARGFGEEKQGPLQGGVIWAADLLEALHEIIVSMKPSGNKTCSPPTPHHRVFWKEPKNTQPLHGKKPEGIHILIQ
jgi:hypothetical protein